MINRRQFIKRAVGAVVGLSVLGHSAPRTIAQKRKPRKRRRCPRRCVIIEMQGRQNEPATIYTVCD